MGKRWLALTGLLVLFGAFELYVWQTGRHRPERTPSGASGFERHPLEYFPHLRPGERVPGFEAERLDGGTERIVYPVEGSKTLLFIMSLTCDTCSRMMPKWNAIADDVAGDAKVFGIVLGSYQREQQLLKEKRLTFPAVRFPTKDVMDRYKAHKVPQTILVAPGGEVEESVLGALSDEQLGSLVARIRDAAEGVS